MRTPSTRHAAQQFAAALNRGLFRYYSRNPSAAMVAREFNLRSGSGVPISQEASRKWMRGHTVPELAKMQVLAKWLDLDLRAINGSDEITPVGEPLTADSSNPTSLDTASGLGLREQLLHLIEELDRPRAEIVLGVMLGLIRLSATQVSSRFGNDCYRGDQTLKPDEVKSTPFKTAQTDPVQDAAVSL